MTDSRGIEASLVAELDAAQRRIAELESQLEGLGSGAPGAAGQGLLRAVLDAVADGILAVDQEGRVVFANRQFLRMWRIPPDLIEAGDDSELLEFVQDQLVDPDEFARKVRELYASTRDGYDILHFRDGRVFERVSRALAAGDHLMGRVWCFRDVSQQSRVEEEC
jgi:PAS domain-containing protein